MSKPTRKHQYYHTLYLSSPTTAFDSVSLAIDSWLHVQYGSYQNQKWGLTDTRFKRSGTKELALRQNSDADCSSEEGQDELTWLFQFSRLKNLPKLHFCVHVLPLALLNQLSNDRCYILRDAAEFLCISLSFSPVFSIFPVLPPSPFWCPAQHPTTQSSAQSSKVQSSESLAFDAIGPDAVERCSPIRDGLLVPGDLGKGNTVVGFNMDL